MTSEELGISLNPMHTCGKCKKEGLGLLRIHEHSEFPGEYGHLDCFVKFLVGKFVKEAIEIENWVVVRSASGKHALGYPIGEILCRHPRDVQKAIEDYGIRDPIVEPYLRVIAGMKNDANL